MDKHVIAEVNIIRYTAGKAEEVADSVVVESWLELFVNDRLLVQLPLCDKDTEALIYGVLYVEGYLEPGERVSMERIDNAVYVELDREVDVKPKKDQLECYTSKMELGEEIEKLPVTTIFEAEKVLELSKIFKSLPSIYQKTGGVHLAAFAGQEIVHWADDISRRSAIDKVLGKCFLTGTPPAEGFVICSGRVASDMVIRMIKAKVSMIVSLSAPSDKALAVADAYGITVCGYARGKRFNIYTCRDRIKY